MPPRPQLSKDTLAIDAAAESDRICAWIRDTVQRTLNRRGAVVALSGGIDSSVVGALCVRALGRGNVFGLLLPEQDSSPETLTLSRLIAEHLGIEFREQDITPVLAAAGCYRNRDEAIRSVVPEYEPGWRHKIVLPNVLEGGYRVFSLVAVTPQGPELRVRLPLAAYLTIVASTNFKQRTRKMLEYFEADRQNYSVAGTPNLLEYDQGFFVKLGDGAADFKPIAHLYKSQVYQMARELAVPEAIGLRPPTTDTYSLPQSQEEFYFSLPYDKMDLCLYARRHDYSAEDAAGALGLTADQVGRVYQDIESKRRAARYLHLPPQVMGSLGPEEAPTS